MPRQQTPAQRETVERVMHEFKHGELKTAHGKRKVKNPKQAIAIALHEAGASKVRKPGGEQAQPAPNQGEGARGEPPRRAEGRDGGEKTKAELYEEAKKRDIPGRSKMNKQQLDRRCTR